jgi:pseudaminic acid biosynthesis-associated methylase
MQTGQMEAWSGEFGAEYTRRNCVDPDQFDREYGEWYGHRRTELNERFLGHLPRDARILEVGTNVGNQLALLGRMGFTALYGVELQWGAIDLARQRVPRTNVVQGSAFEIPFRDAWFDVVFTSGVLIHIAPDDLGRVMDEMHRCARRYVFGCEYYAEAPTALNYRGRDGLLWKMDYARGFRARFPRLGLAREEHLRSRFDATVDHVYLLEKPA